MRGRTTLALVFMLALVAVSTAGAGERIETYWGYNYMSASNPGAGTCPSQPSGFACIGWNYWDRSQIEINSGSAHITAGFLNCDGCIPKGYSYSGTGIHTTVRRLYNESATCTVYGSCINAYNRVECNYAENVVGPYAYVQCRAIIYT